VSGVAQGVIAISALITVLGVIHTIGDTFRLLKKEDR
jgi:hypothetical protein